MNEYFLECLANPWVFNSVAEFQSSVRAGVIIESDGCGNLLFINKKTLKLEEGDDCFRDGIDVWKIAEDEDQYDLHDDPITKIINHFSNEERQLIGVLWYNK